QDAITRAGASGRHHTRDAERDGIRREHVRPMPMLRLRLVPRSSVVLSLLKTRYALSRLMLSPLADSLPADAVRPRLAVPNRATVAAFSGDAAARDSRRATPAPSASTITPSASPPHPRRPALVDLAVERLEPMAIGRRDRQTRNRRGLAPPRV